MAQADGRGQRGRKPKRPDPGAGPVAAFADQLWRLKIAAGDPSFAEMSSQLGAAASKSSLAAAAQGRALPSWGTTWEFVRVLAVERLGHDPEATKDEWHARWRQTKVFADLEDADLAETDVATGKAVANVSLPDTFPATMAPRAELDVATVPYVVQAGSLPRRFRLNARSLVTAAFAIVTVIAGGAAFLLNGRSSETPPTRQALDSQPPLQVDDSRFEGDITYQDGTSVKKGESFEKVWRLRNVGTVEWEGRFLMRVNDAICRAPRRVEIPRTPPGHSVDIRVGIQAPHQPGTCKIFWKMVDSHGHILFPDKRPIFLDVRVS